MLIRPCDKSEKSSNLVLPNDVRVVGLISKWTTLLREDTNNEPALSSNRRAADVAPVPTGLTRTPFYEEVPSFLYRAKMQ